MAASVTTDVLATNVANAPACIAQCQLRFLDTIIDPHNDDAHSHKDDTAAVPPSQLDQGETLAPVCEALTGHDAVSGNPRLWPLYCCDQALCGVFVDLAAQARGQDPNVNSIINRCQNIGFYSVYDPGPPSSCPKAWLDALTLASPADGPEMTSLAAASTVLVSTLSFAASSSSLSSALFSSSFLTSSWPTSTAVAGTASTAFGNDNSDPGLATKIRVAVIICAALASLLLAGLLVFFLVRRRHRLRSHRAGPLFSRTGRRHHLAIKHSPSPLTDPALAPLVSSSPVDSVAGRLVPPARLRERRLLPTILAPVWSASTLALPRAPPPSATVRAFPLSPICAPTSHKLEPRRERSALPRRHDRARSAALSPLRSPSLESGVATPTRPPRPHPGPLHIPGLVSTAAGLPPRGLSAPLPAVRLDPTTTTPLPRDSWGSWGGGVGRA